MMRLLRTTSSGSGGHLSGGQRTGSSARRQRVRIGAPDPTLTPVSGMVAVSELVERLDVIGRLDAVIGPIKQRRRGHTGGQLLVGMAAAQLAGEDFLVGLDRQRADAAGQQLAPVPGLVRDDRGRAGPPVVRHAVGGGGDRAGRRARRRAGHAGRGGTAAGGRADRERDDRSGHHRRRGLRPPQARGGVQPPGPAGRAPARGHLGGHRDGAGRGPAGGQRGSPPRRPRAVAPGVGRAARARRGPGGSGCAPTPATSPASWPAPPCSPRSSSRSGPGGSPRCGGCWTASPRPTGPTRSTCPPRRSPWPTTAPTGGPPRPGC